MSLSFSTSHTNPFYLIFLDFGIDNLTEAMENSNFPWLLSNVDDIETDKPLADAPVSHVIEIDGIKVKEYEEIFAYTHQYTRVRGDEGGGGGGGC